MEKLKVYWWGYGGSMYLADELRPMIEELGMTLTTISEWDNANIKWELNTWLNHLKEADIIIIPTNHEKQPSKSNTRLTQALSLGKPTVCGPLDAYLAIDKKFPGSFLIARIHEDWKLHLAALRDNVELRKQLSERALVAAQAYSVEAMGRKWANILFGENNLIQKPVDLIVVNYNNPHYLRLTVESIQRDTSYPFNLIISDAGSNKETQDYLKSLKNVTVVGGKERLNYSEASNAGIEVSKADYFAILNSDLVVTEGWLKNIMANFQTVPRLAACGVFSNCDKGWLHNESLRLEKSGIDLIPGMLYETIQPHVDELYEYGARLNQTRTGYKEQEWVAGYATVFSRKAVNEIGLFDPQFKNGCEDLDFCKRLRKYNYNIGQALNSFVFHFGGVSRGAYQIENREKYDGEDQANHGYLRVKWSQPRVMLYTGPAWERWDFRSLEKTGIGGSEVWLTQLSRELTKVGYRVEVFADCPEPGIMDGNVKWLHYTYYPEWVKYHWVDYSILSRTTDPLHFPLRSGKIFTQIHDVFYLNDKSQTFRNKINKHGVLSEWHADFVSDYHQIPKNELAIMANGINFKRFDDVQVERHPYRIHWSSSWDRGLDNVLYLWPFIKKNIPEAELHVFYGCYNWKKKAEMDNNQEELKKIKIIEDAMKQPGVFNHGRKSQQELAVEMKKASLWLYPSSFSETFCITGIEAQYAGVPVICNRYAGVITTLGDSAVMLGDGSPYWPYSKEGREAFLSHTVNLLKDRDLWETWSKRGRQNAEKYSWENCAIRWKELFEKG